MKTAKNLISNEDIEAIKNIYSGINRNDIESVLKLFDSNVVRVEFEDLPTGGTYRGHHDLKHHIAKGRNTWAEGKCDPVDFVVAGNKAVVTVHVKVRLKGDLNWIDAHTTDGFSLKDGRVTEFHSFTTKEKAFAWAGLNI